MFSIYHARTVGCSGIVDTVGDGSDTIVATQGVSEQGENRETGEMNFYETEIRNGNTLVQGLEPHSAESRLVSPMWVWVAIKLLYFAGVVFGSLKLTFSKS